MRGTCNTTSQIKFKISKLRTHLCDYSNACINGTFTGAITGAGENDTARRIDQRNKGVIFQNCAPFTDCVSEINNTQIDNAKYIVVVMPMYDLTEYSDNLYLNHLYTRIK